MLISIDHGNKQIKAIHSPPFVSGLQTSISEPFGKNILKFNNQYYIPSNQRIPYHRDKTEDERFFILTLIAIAREMEVLEYYSKDLITIQLAVGLPPAHFGSQNRIFTDYFSDRSIINFDFNHRPYTIYIEKVICFPQAYAAAITMLPSLMTYSKVLVIDIGGFTADYLFMRNGVADLSTCDSLENGIILLYNKIRSKISAEFDLLLEENDIDSILTGITDSYQKAVILSIQNQAQKFINDLFSTLRERMLDLRSGRIIFVGGGSILLKSFITSSKKLENVIVIDDIHANAKGYELLYQIETTGRLPI